jgi:hypothetical protein
MTVPSLLGTRWHIDRIVIHEMTAITELLSPSNATSLLFASRFIGTHAECDEIDVVTTRPPLGTSSRSEPLPIMLLPLGLLL